MAKGATARSATATSFRTVGALAAGLLATVVALAFAAATLGAHAEVLRSVPAEGDVLPTAPADIRIWFSEPIEAVTDAIVIYGPDGRRVGGGSAGDDTDRTLLRSGVDSQARGTYTVRWKAISADGHPIHGAFSFSVGATSSSTSSPLPADDDQSTLALSLQSLGRWLHFASLALVSGPLVLIAVLGSDRDRAVDRRLWWMATGGAALALPAAAVALLAQQTSLTGSPASLFHTSVAAWPIAGRWGTLWLARIGVALVVLGAATCRATARLYLAQRISLFVLVTATAAFVIVTSLNGHSAVTEPVWLSLAVDSIHVAATSVWVGGLIALALVVMPRIGPSGNVTADLIRRVVPRFSTVAFVSVELLVLTGAYHAWAHIDGPRALTTTDYGVALLVKVALIVLTLIPAAFNLLFVRPRAAALAGAADVDVSELRQRFGYAIRVEALLAVGILAVAAVLSSLPPAVHAEHPASLAAKPVENQEHLLLSHAGESPVVLTFSPGEVGSNRVRLLVPDDEHSGDGGGPRLRVVPPEAAGIAPWTINPARDSDGFAATVDFAVEGAWQLVVERTGGPPATFVARIPSLGAGELLTRAERTMNALQSVVAETQSAAAGEVIASRHEYQAPDREHRRSAADEEIVIGPVRYMRHGDAWHSHDEAAFRWPAFALAGSARDVAIAGLDNIDGSDCVVASFVNNTEGSKNYIWIDSGTWRVRQQVAMTPNRITTIRYTAFNRPTRIVAPVH